MVEPLLEIRNLVVSADDQAIVNGLDLVVQNGEIHALMGPNGAGKSTLANALMGHPGYTVTADRMALSGQDLRTMRPDERARAGLFLAFQYPESIAGVSVVQFLRQALAARRNLDELSILEVRLELMEWMDRLGMDGAFAERHLNEGFSGGERKRNEVLQLALLQPTLALLDETDSGLDIDALKVVARGVRTVREKNPEMGTVVVTHYHKLLEELRPDRVHVLVDGRIVREGGVELAAEIEAEGYDAFRVVAR
jgi:Fe-S cluster assembly ATP-binding protein